MSTAFDYQGLHVVEASPQPLEALVAQDNRSIAAAAASLKQDTTVVDIANAIVITDETYGEAERYLVSWKVAKKEALATFDPICKSADETHKKATAARAAVVSPFDEACAILGGKLAGHLAAKQRERLEAERQRMEAARLLAAQQREEEIETAEASGASRDEIGALCEMPLPPAPIVSTPRRTAGSSPISLRTTYKGRVTNHLALVQYIAKNPQFLSLIPIDQAALNRLAGSLKTTAQLPGVEFYADNSTSTRTVARRS